MAPVTALADRFLDLAMEREPLVATLLGDHRFDDRLADLSVEADEAYGARLRRLLTEAEAIDDGDLDDEERITLAMVVLEANDELDAIASRLLEFTVAPTMVGAHALLLESLPKVPIAEAAHAGALIARHRAVPRYLAQALDRLRDGIAAGRTPPARAVRQSIRQLDELLATPLDADPFLAPAPADDALRRVVADVTRPALAAYRATLEDEVLAHSRTDDRSGLSWLPDGPEVYRREARRYTSLAEVDPDAVHAIGLAEIERLAGEYRDLGGRVLNTTDLPEIFARLRDDPSLRFSSSAEVLAAAEAALRRAEAAVPDWFGRLPQAPCGVLPMADHEVKDGTVAYYLPPATDGSRGGTYYVNTYLPHTRTRFESEALAFHEAVPGHHTQMALAQELAHLPRYRRLASVNAYLEGWALYTERLADEMGLYSNDVSRLGMLAFDSWRAGRLVVDTGLHHLGWGRNRAVAYLREHSPLALNNIDNEVDRYIAWPGQALGYKIGQLEILRLRRGAEDALGDRFDVRGFHDVVLGHGALPLAVLDDVVSRWVERRRPGGRPSGRP